ncbi:MAG: hypothetical protein IJ141_01080 [Lachnospiraceae bacterium]|nr:hypothetical protein [Lachnospiraceae bacterium]
MQSFDNGLYINSHFTLNLKTGVNTHPKHGEIILNDAYLSFAEHYQVAVMPTAVKKPKQKPSVEGSVGKIARKIIGMLRNESFHSLEGLNRGIREALEKLNNKSFQKRSGSRKIIFEVEEKPLLRNLPLIPFEICEWSYGRKVNPNSHVWFDKGQYSVPSDYIGSYVDIRYSTSMVYIYSSHKQIASHKRITPGVKNGKRTEPSHLPYKLYTPDTVDSTTEKAKEIGVNTHTVVCRLYREAKVQEQALMDVRSVLDIANLYNDEILEEACRLALKDFHKITYNTLMPYVKILSKDKIFSNETTIEKKSKGIVRGADYYRNGGTD